MGFKRRYIGGHPAVVPVLGRVVEHGEVVEFDEEPVNGAFVPVDDDDSGASSDDRSEED